MSKVGEKKKKIIFCLYCAVGPSPKKYHFFIDGWHILIFSRIGKRYVQIANGSWLSVSLTPQKRTLSLCSLGNILYAGTQGEI